jgi:hypothetical protein
MSTVAAARGQKRRDPGNSPAMLVEESRLFQVVTFQTLHRRQGELDQDQVLLDVMVIRGRGGFSAHAIRVLLGNATSSARSLGATLNSPRLSVGHDAAWSGLSGLEFAFLARPHATSRAMDSLYLFESRLLGFHGCGTYGNPQKEDGQFCTANFG